MTLTQKWGRFKAAPSVPEFIIKIIYKKMDIVFRNFLHSGVLVRGVGKRLLPLFFKLFHAIGDRLAKPLGSSWAGCRPSDPAQSL